jgi:hypothetical protein
MIFRSNALQRAVQGIMSTTFRKPCHLGIK